LNKARDIILTLNLNGYDITIKIGNTSTLTGGLSWTSAPINGSVILEGDTGTPSNTIISTTSIDAVYVNADMKLTIRYVKLQTTTSGNCVYASGGRSEIEIGDGVIFGASASYHIRARGTAYVRCSSAAYSITGGAITHLNAGIGGTIDMTSITVTLTGTPAFVSAFASTTICGAIIATTMTYSGSATGARYDASLNGVIQTGGGGATYFPGNASGVTATGGLYA
jgi:hypothetical protein